jgi:hypothetical protein
VRNLHYLADLLGTWVEVDEKVPSGLYVGNLHYFADLLGTGLEVDGVIIHLCEKVSSGL